MDITLDRAQKALTLAWADSLPESRTRITVAFADLLRWAWSKLLPSVTSCLVSLASVRLCFLARKLVILSSAHWGLSQSMRFFSASRAALPLRNVCTTKPPICRLCPANPGYQTNNLPVSDTVLKPLGYHPTNIRLLPWNFKDFIDMLLL